MFLHSVSGLISFLFCFHSIGFSRLFTWDKWSSVYSRHLPYLQELAQTSHVFGLDVIRTFAVYILAPLKACQRHQVVLQCIIYSAVLVKLGSWLHQPFKTRYHYCCLKTATAQRGWQDAFVMWRDLTVTWSVGKQLCTLPSREGALNTTKVSALGEATAPQATSVLVK